MSDSPSKSETADVAARSEGPGAHIGRYKILQQIGEGGFGAVFEAEQMHPVKRRVALKLIKLGMDTREVLARFEAERQALAMMDHPHIARVLDAGASESGRPYFVMELVKGDPISTYCDKRNLSIPARLDLLGQVCAAVQHAHTKGVIHRDIKPSNILVSTLEDKPFAKVIDFGIAKATTARLTDKTLFTAQQQMIGTPVYMSPEQAEGSGDIDTRTDIFALGVLLYKLLTDTTPFESASRRHSDATDFKKIICEVDPPTPSSYLSQSANTLRDIAILRSVEPRRLAKMVRGELDWIVMKAIEKDRTRRYETASAMATDIRRYLSGQPVLAAPPSTTYRLQKFVGRNKGAVASGVLITIALIAGSAVFAWQAQVARARAHELEQVTHFQAQMLADVDPSRAGSELNRDIKTKFSAALIKAGISEQNRLSQMSAFSSQLDRVNATDVARDLIDNTVLKRAVATIDIQFKDQPRVDANLRQVLADLYRNIGLLYAAMPLQEQALATRRRYLGDSHPDTLFSLDRLADLMERAGRLSEAEPYFREALVQRRRVLGDQDPATKASMLDLGTVLRLQGKLTEAEPYYREVLALNRHGQPGEKPDRGTLLALDNIGALLADEAKFREAETYSREALDTGRKFFGDDSRDTLIFTNNLATILEDEGKLKEAEALHRDVFEKNRTTLGEQHPYTLSAAANLGYTLFAEDNLIDAEMYLRDSLEKRRQVLGPEHRETLSETITMGGLLVAEGKFSEAQKLLSAAEPSVRATFASNGNQIAWLLTTMGRARTANREFDAAEGNLTESYSLLMKHHHSKRSDVRDVLMALVRLYSDWQRADPMGNHEAKATEWQGKLEEFEATVSASARTSSAQQ